jgi:type III secretory pathway component EscU
LWVFFVFGAGAVVLCVVVEALLLLVVVAMVVVVVVVVVAVVAFVGRGPLLSAAAVSPPDARRVWLKREC